MQSLWFRNNRYVLSNKVYYRGSGGGAGAKASTMFVPLKFMFEQEIEEISPEEELEQNVIDFKSEQTGVYDAMGRKIITAEEMANGQWQKQLAPGLYIINGKKVSVK